MRLLLPFALRMSQGCKVPFPSILETNGILEHTGHFSVHLYAAVVSCFRGSLRPSLLLFYDDIGCRWLANLCSIGSVSMTGTFMSLTLVVFVPSTMSSTFCEVNFG